MANTRIIEMQVKQIIRLHEKGESARQISKMLGIHRKTVSEYISRYKSSEKSIELLLKPETDINKALGIEIEEKPKAQRYIEALNFIDSQKKYKHNPGFTIENMYHDYLSMEYKQTYSRPQFYRIVRGEWRREMGSLRLNHAYGDKLFVDYTGKKLKYIDKETGEILEAEVLVCMLPASQYIYVEAMVSQKKHDFIKGVMNAMDDIGGVPKGIISDNLKSAVTKAGKYQSTINKTFQDMALHYETSIDPTRPYHPKDKALVEGAVRIAYQSIFYQMSKHTHFSISDLNESIKPLLKQLNGRKSANKDHSRKELFEQEKAYLSPLPHYAFESKEYRKAKVQKMGYVYCSTYKNYYSVPYRYIGKQVELRYDHKTLEVYYKGERLATHPTHQAKGKYTTINGHLSSENQAYMEWCPEYFSKRAKAQGTNIQQYIDRLIDQRPYPEQAYKQAQGILALHKQYNQSRVDKACQLAMDYPKSSYQMIKSILQNKQDIIQQRTITDIKAIPKHDNVRGANYYS